MKVKDGRITECTEAELFMRWLRNWKHIIDYYSFKQYSKEAGIKIINGDENYGRESVTDSKRDV